MKGEKRISFCEIEREKRKGDRAIFYKHLGNFRWKGVRIVKYKDKAQDWSDVIRMVLVGTHNASTRFHLRYFEIETQGFSSLEGHRHEHVVVCVRGKGDVLVGRKRYQMQFLDTLYIPPNKPHQFKNSFDEPFGFFCIVNAKRDRPKVLDQKDCPMLR